MKVRCGASTDVGRMRDHNEDSYKIGEGDTATQLGYLFVVCDGMGGHASGEVASQLGVDTIVASYYADVAVNRAAALEQSFQTANQRIYTQGRGSMGTTGVAALLLHDLLHIANVGDSRAYLVRGGGIQQISRDHSLVAEQVEAGIITAAQARHSMIKNVITRALGHQQDTDVDLFRLPIEPADVVLLCSDGLHGLVEDDELAQAAAADDLDAACRALVDLANQRGGSDNITVLLVRVDELDALPVEDSEPSAEAITEPLPAAPITERIIDLDIAPDRAEAAAPADAVAPQPSAPLPPASVPPTERPLTRMGAVLSLLLLVVLVGVLAIALLRPTALPDAAPSPATLPATTVATTVPSAASTANATAAATANATPASSATAPPRPTP